jgi:single-strand DNA-binding protein
MTMALSYNSVTLAGNLTRDVEVRYLANDQCVGSFGIAVNRRYKGRDGETQEETTFVDITVWGKLAEQCSNSLRKGSGVLVDGRLKQESWEDKATGQKRSKLLVTASEVHFVDSRRDSDATANPQQSEASSAPRIETEDDAVPF